MSKMYKIEGRSQGQHDKYIKLLNEMNTSHGNLMGEMPLMGCLHRGHGLSLAMSLSAHLPHKQASWQGCSTVLMCLL